MTGKNKTDLFTKSDSSISRRAFARLGGIGIIVVAITVTAAVIGIIV